MNNEVTKSIHDKCTNPSPEQKYLRRFVSCENRNSSQSVRLVWRSKSDMQYENLEKVLGLANHRKKSLDRELNVTTFIHNDTARSEGDAAALNSASTDKQSTTGSIEVRINKEKITVPSVKGLKTFFEKVRAQQDAIVLTDSSKTYQTAKKIKINPLFLRIVDTKHIAHGYKTYAATERTPNIDIIGKTDAIETVEFNSETNIDASQLLSANHAPKLDTERNSSIDKDISNGNSSLNDLSTVITDNIRQNEVSMVETAKYVITSDNPDILHSKEKTRTCEVESFNEKTLLASIGPPTNILREPKVNVLKIRATWENLIADSYVRRKSSQSFEESRLLSKLRSRSTISRHNHYNVSNVNNIADSPIGITLKTKSETDPIHDHESLLPTRQIVDKFESNGVQSTNDKSVCKANQSSPERINCANIIPEDKVMMIEDAEPTSVEDKRAPTQEYLSTHETQGDKHIDKTAARMNYSSEDMYNVEVATKMNHDCDIVDKNVEMKETQSALQANLKDVVEGAKNGSVDADENFTTAYLDKQNDQTKVVLIQSNEVGSNREILQENIPELLSPSKSQRIQELSVLAARKHASVITSRNNINRIAFTKLDTSVSLPFPKEADHLEVFQRRGSSKLRPLHPDELSFFQKPLLKGVRKERSYSDASYNRK